MTINPDINTAEDCDLDLLSRLITKANRSGADAADALLVNGQSITVTCRNGSVESLERSDGYDIGLRVLVGKRQAIVSSSDSTPKALDDLVERAVAMARQVPEDSFIGLADPSELARDVPRLTFLIHRKYLLMIWLPCLVGPKMRLDLFRALPILKGLKLRGGRPGLSL